MAWLWYSAVLFVLLMFSHSCMSTRACSSNDVVIWWKELRHAVLEKPVVPQMDGLQDSDLAVEDTRDADQRGKTDIRTKNSRDALQDLMEARPPREAGRLPEKAKASQA